MAVKVNHNYTPEKFHQYWESHLLSTFLPKITEQEVWDKYKTRSLTFVRDVWYYLYRDTPEDLDECSREYDEQLKQYLQELQTVEPLPEYTDDETLWWSSYICPILNHTLGARKFAELGFNKRWFVDHLYLMNQEDQKTYIDKLVEQLKSQH